MALDGVLAMKQMRGAAARNGKGDGRKEIEPVYVIVLWPAFVLSLVLVLTVATSLLLLSFWST